jgi:CheY-like chemotaxis protein/anti-sigma regulatory factor (Ser/Thr protein kinase)
MRFADGLAEIAHLFELQAAGRGLQFSFEVEGHLPAVVRADEKRLRQILINLLGNALKFTAAGRVALRVRYQREMARFEIADTGPGMGEEELSRVFEPFERGRAATGMSVGSTGLGLTIARMLTALMGGELTVASTPGVGTTFTVRLFLPEARDAWPAAAQAQRRTGYSGPRRRVLVVDNEEPDRRLLADLLQPLGFEVHSAASGEEALVQLARSAPQGGSAAEGAPAIDAVFMDLAMPGIDGWATITALRAAGHRMPVAVVSANAFDKRPDNPVGLAQEDFLVKPVRVAELLDWLGRQLQLRWVLAEQPAAAAASAVPANTASPSVAAAAAPEANVPNEWPHALLQSLQQALALGHVRGVQQHLATLEKVAAEPGPEGAAWAALATLATRLRPLAQQYRFEAMNQLIQTTLEGANQGARSTP